MKTSTLAFAALTLAALTCAAVARAADWAKTEASLRDAHAKHETAAQNCADEKAKLAKIKNPLAKATHLGPMQQACNLEMGAKAMLTKACQDAAPASKGDKAREKLVADDCAGLPLTPPAPLPVTKETPESKWKGVQYTLQQKAKTLDANRDQCKNGAYGGLKTEKQRKDDQKQACRLVDAGKASLKIDCDQDARYADTQEKKDWLKQLCEGELSK